MNRAKSFTGWQSCGTDDDFERVAHLAGDTARRTNRYVYEGQPLNDLGDDFVTAWAYGATLYREGEPLPRRPLGARDSRVREVIALGWLWSVGLHDRYVSNVLGTGIPVASPMVCRQEHASRMRLFDLAVHTDLARTVA